MSLKNNYSHTLRACYIAYITQAISVNFAPLLFVTFRNTYSITLTQLSVLIAFTFILQMIVDFTSTNFVDKIGYRVSGMRRCRAYSGGGRLYYAWLSARYVL